jgi:ATP synthase protein I
LTLPDPASKVPASDRGRGCGTMANDDERPPADDFDARLKRALAARDEDRKSGDRDGGDNPSGVGFAFRIGVEIVAALVAGIGLGYLLDRWLGTLPWLTVLFFVFGSAAGILNVFRLARRLEGGDDGPTGADGPHRP